MNINNTPACQVLLVYAGAKFGKTYLHWGLTSYNKKMVKLGVQLKMIITELSCIYAWKVLLAPTLVIETPLLTVSQECVYWNWKTMILKWAFLKLRHFQFKHNRNFNPISIWIMVIYIINMMVCIVIFHKTVWLHCFFIVSLQVCKKNNKYIGNRAISNFFVLFHKNKCFC